MQEILKKTMYMDNDALVLIYNNFASLTQDSKEAILKTTMDAENYVAANVKPAESIDGTIDVFIGNPIKSFKDLKAELKKAPQERDTSSINSFMKEFLPTMDEDVLKNYNEKQCNVYYETFKELCNPEYITLLNIVMPKNTPEKCLSIFRFLRRVYE